MWHRDCCNRGRNHDDCGGRSAVGFYLLGPDWANLDYLGLFLGLLAAGVLLAATVWLRRYRWEI